MLALFRWHWQISRNRVTLDPQFVVTAPPIREKNQNLFGNSEFYGLSNDAKNNFYALPIFEEHDSEVKRGGGGGGGGLLASRKANANFFPRVLREIRLVPDLWALQRLFRYITDDRPQTTHEKLSTL